MKQFLKAAFGLLLVCACGWCFAATDGGGASAGINEFLNARPAAERDYWQGRLLCPSVITDAVDEERGLMRTAADWITGADKERRIKALGAYLYNMYISSAAQKHMPQTLDLTFTGVLDPLENLPGGYAPGDMAKLYERETAAVQNHIARRFKQRAGISYDPSDKENAAAERFFLRVLEQSAVKGRAGYRLSHGRMEAERKKEADESLKRALVSCLSTDDHSVCTYERTDMLDLLDRKRGSVPKEHFYRPVRSECDACSYAGCRSACQAARRDYAGWKMAALHRIYAWPSAGKFVRSREKREFFSPQGERYPDWDYHAAALVTLYKDKQRISLVQDPFLFEEPVSLETWADRFDAASTVFYARPFRRLAGTEKQFVRISPDQLDNLRQGKTVTVNGVSYKPAPVRQAAK